MEAARDPGPDLDGADSVEVWTLRGLTRLCVYRAIDVAARRVHIADITDGACGDRVIRTTRGILDAIDGLLLPHLCLIHDRDPTFTDWFAEHHHPERDHQGLGARLIDGGPESEPVADVQCDERPGGLLRSCRHAA